ncbi:MAG: hypothetical protein ACUVT6_07290, partial [Thermodesulfobacteriota bacterium]
FLGFRLYPTKRSFVEMPSLWKAWKSLTTFPHSPQRLGKTYFFPHSHKAGDGFFKYDHKATKNQVSTFEI